MDPTSPLYDQHRVLIKNLRKNNKSWSEIDNFGTDELLSQRATSGEFNISIDHAEWIQLVDFVKEGEEHETLAFRISMATEDDATVGPEITSEFQMSDDSGSSWMCYKQHLFKQGWYEGSVKSLEDSTLKILKRMSRNTRSRDKGPVKGLVVGHVQSGKTASMAALMAAGADNGFNFFIILSGTIENLRKQTSERLFRDLNHPGNLSWHQLSRLGANQAEDHKIYSLQLRSGSHARYFTVTLKNKTRLEKLHKWLKSDPAQLAHLRIVIIDDEADQASINTGGNVHERKAINKLIISLVDIKAEAVNYVAYTATPYSCFLNEAFEESLYPRDFIKTLPQSSEHFGPIQLFGIPGEREGLSIIREISTPPAVKDNDSTSSQAISDLEMLDELYSDTEASLPPSLEDSIAWFICAAACMRLRENRRPVTMMIHISQLQIHHEAVGTSVKKWLESGFEPIMDKCRSIWSGEITTFTRDTVREQFPEYRLSDSISDYPPFEDLYHHIEDLISTITHIKISGDDATPEYHEGIHVCIDNSSNSGITDEKEHIRLLYPDYENPAIASSLCNSPAFIVIGGTTLSRGLTLEGLVSTYFLRSSTQADTLMQMGRWFGYRRNYELLPRIWLTNATKEKFEYLSGLEQDLRNDLQRYEQDHISPSEFAPRVKSSVKSSWMLPTAKNRMCNAEPTEMDYSGMNTQTTLFVKDALQYNISVTEQFLKSLGIWKPSVDGSARIWLKVERPVVWNYLRSMRFHENSVVFSDIEPFIQWFEEVRDDAGYADWNVVLGGVLGPGKEDDRWVPFDSWKVERKIAKRSSNKDYIVKVMRAPRDLLVDAFFADTIQGGLKNSDVLSIRASHGVGSSPQLLLYRIKRDAGKSDAGRVVPEHDLIGASIWIPGVRNSRANSKFTRMLSVKLPGIALDEEKPEGD